MQMTAIHNELMRTRTLPNQCRTNEVDSYNSGKYINRAFDSYIISVLPWADYMMIIVFPIMAKPHTNCNRISDCCFILLNMSSFKLNKFQETREVESIFKHCFLTIFSTYSTILMVR